MKPIGERVASIEARQGDFDKWNDKQNGRLDRMDDKLGLIHRWLLALMGSVTLGLLLTIIGIIIK